MLIYHPVKSKILTPYIHKIYSINNHSTTTYKCLPSVYPLLTFLFDSELKYYSNKFEVLKRENRIEGHLILPLKEATEVITEGYTREISIVFQPFAISNFYSPKTNIHQADQLINPLIIWRDKFNQLKQSLSDSTSSLEKKIDQISSFLENLLLENKTQTEPKSPEEIYQSLKKSPPRSYHRKFSELAFVSPKQFEKIVRFRNTIHQAKSNDFEILTQILYDQGYYDQSHFNRDCKFISKITPKKLLKKQVVPKHDVLWCKD